MSHVPIMSCSSCQHENDPSASFCEECGARLGSRTCAACGFDLKASAKFCPSCGRQAGSTAAAEPARAPRSYTPKHLADKILRSRSVLEGERKRVTVLFADVKGSMELAEQVDPEEWHKILDRFFQILTDGVHRFEGTVNQYTGDGIMALFGAPIAHEDHAQRACYAALTLRDELRTYADEMRVERGLNFGTRFGLNSGEVVVGTIGDDLRMDYTAQGHTVGLAQRMEALADSRSIVISAHTARFVEGYFALRDLGETRLKGVSEPLRIYELEGVGTARTRLDVSRTRGLSRFVGRGDEMATLQAALEQSLNGQGQAVGVVADAGVGKSRLCFEFAESCRARGITVYEGHCPAHGKTIPFLPVFELLRGYFGISERDNDQNAREKIVGRLLLLDRSFEDLLPLVFDFLGIGEPGDQGPRIDPELRQRQLFGFIRHLVQARSEREPAVILIDDLHWTDAGSDAFIAQVIEVVGTTRTMMLVNFRPEYEAEWTRKTYYRQIPLVPLGPAEIRELITDMLGVDPSVASLSELIRDRTRGNPFFIEEIVQSLIESGHLRGAKGAYRLVTPLDKLEVPSSVESILSARIDRLHEGEKRVLQNAAVIGREFDEPCLSRIADLPAEDLAGALHALESAEFIGEQALYPRAEYAFKHPLTHEVAYNSQLGERRARVHAAVARAIEMLEPDKLDDRAALLAHHWELAGERYEAARWNARAAARSHTADPQACARQWRKVYELVGPSHDSEDAASLRMQACLQILSVGGWRLGGSNEEMDALFEEGKAFGERRHDKQYLAELALAYAAFIGLSSGNMRVYADRAREVGRLADETGDPEVQCSAGIIMGYSHFRCGRLDDSVRFANRVRELSAADHRLGSRSIGICSHPWSFISGGWSEVHLGRLADARVHFERGLELSRALDDRENLSWGLGFRTTLEQMSGELSNGEADCREAVGLAETPFVRIFALHALGLARILRCDWSPAIEVLKEALLLLHESRTAAEQEPETLAWLAEAQNGAGLFDLARETARQAIEIARVLGTRISELEAHLALARTLLASDGAAAGDAVDAALNEAQIAAEECGARGFAPQIHVERGRLAAARGDDAARTRIFGEAHRLFTEIGATGHAQRLARELGSS